MDVLVIVVLVIVVALVFDFTNGFHDTANAMATSVATGALKPRTAVLISAVLNVVGAFLSTEVAKTVSQGGLEAGAVDLGRGVELALRERVVVLADEAQLDAARAGVYDERPAHSQSRTAGASSPCSRV